jgi:hypothetical protein
LHPRHQKSPLPISQAIGMARICSNILDLKENLNIVRERLIFRKYPAEIIDKAFDRALNYETMEERFIESSEEGNTRMIVTFNSSLSNLNVFIQKHKHLLECDEIVPKLVFRKNKNLSNFVVMAKIYPERVYTSNSDIACNSNIFVYQRVAGKIVICVKKNETYK